MIDFKNFRLSLKQKFKQNGLDSKEVDLIICEVLKVDFSRLILLEKISLHSYLKISGIVRQRLKNKPLTKIFHKAYFYGLDFYVNNDVLSPRQETEILVENALKFIKNDNLKVLDLCTGSGAIAISIAKNSNAKVFASDISPKALKVAKLNAKLNSADVKFIKSDLLDNIDEKFDIIISNPPYIETETIASLDKEVKCYDPILALDGGADGLRFYKKIIEKIDNYLLENGKILFEIGYNQQESVNLLLKQKGFDTICIKDYSGLPRVVIGKKESYVR